MRKLHKLFLATALCAGAAQAGMIDYLNGVSLGEPLPVHQIRYLDKAPDPQARLTLIDFWATWCAGCIASIPQLNGWQKKFGADGLAVIGATQDSDDDGALKRFLVKFPMEYPIGLEGKPGLHDLLKIRAMPYAILVDSKDIIVWRGQPESLSDAVIAHYLSRSVSAQSAPGP
jgi:thiol-disulfide isomerase/thioredoxin